MFVYTAFLNDRNTCSCLGDIFNIASLANIVFYAFMVLRYAHPEITATAAEINFFDQEWLREGFCVANKGIPYWSSHDLCFYVDTVLVIFGYVIFLLLKDTPGMKSANDIVKWNLLGHLGHGIAHGMIALNHRRQNGDYTELEVSRGIENTDTKTWIELLPVLAIGLGFWFGLLKGMMNQLRNDFVLILAIFSNTGQMFVPRQLGFMYVQTILGISYTATQTTRPRLEKDFAYAAFAFAGVLLSFIPWIESTLCENFASLYGGHLIYDAAIPVLLMSGYVSCYAKELENVKSSKYKKL